MGADEMAEHLALNCPAHDQTWWESWPNLHYQSDPKTPVELPGQDWGGDLSPPPRPGMRVRDGEYVQYSTVQYSTVQYSTVQYSKCYDAVQVHRHLDSSPAA